MIFVWIGLISLVTWLAWPVGTDGLASSPDPAENYGAALKSLEEWQAQEDEFGLHEVCRSKLLTHGSKTEHAILLLHGYTSCPEQFAELGRRFFELGYNVFIPCLDHHGRANRLTDDLKHLTAEGMASFGDRALDVTCGLGEKVTAFGISGGATIVAWLAQNRADLAFAVPLAAFLRASFLPAFLTTPFIRIFTTLPHFFLWWDPSTKADNPYSIYYAYPRYSLRTLSQLMRLGLAVKRQSQAQPPAAGNILLMINDFDPGVSNAELESLYEAWRQTRISLVSTYHFEKELRMVHDIITPGVRELPIEEVYSRIIQQVSALADNDASRARPL